ncbi:MAG TPA: fibronectin type III domain-containing protein, partial [Flavobacterium sp.]|uniref:fibronectin type III domain-containing protein n=1 Tax=Flavobacterium sp. TaxID=239 RepID=UPI002ED3C6DC
MLVALAASCDSLNDALIDEVGNTRVFSPVDVTAKVRNQTSVELNWTANAQADHYVVEFSADDPNFTTIFKTVEVTAEDLPVTVVLEGETLYSIRVKAVSEGLEDSKWTVTTANTLSEQLF